MMPSNISTSPPSPTRNQQDYQTLKRPYFSRPSLDTKETQVEQHFSQSQSPTKKRRVLSEVQVDNDVVIQSRPGVDTIMSSSDNLEEFSTIRIQESPAEEMNALRHLQRVARNAMATVTEVSSHSPTFEHFRNAKPAVEIDIHEDHTSFEDEQMSVAGRPSYPVTPERTLLPYTGPDKHKPLTKAHDFRSMTLLQFTDCPNLIALVEQRGQNHCHDSITSTAKAMFNDLWSMIWEYDMAVLVEMDARDDSDFRKLMHLIMVEYQAAESKRVITCKALGYPH